jgi:hypothetical protein
MTDDRRGVFRLKQVYEMQLSNIWPVTVRYGYFGGGSIATPAIVSTVDRIDYSNDTATVSPRGPLSLARTSLSATGNSSYGWFGGGADAVSTVDRIDYANDTTTASPKGPLSLARYELAATGNSSYGWFGGGLDASIRSTVDRIDYSNDTATASVRGPLSLANYYLAATGNNSYGWFGGGFPGPGARSTVNRIDYANDTATASPRGPLSSVRERLGATGNSSYGWFGGGGPTSFSRVDRIDYSNDTATASPRGPLSLGRFYLAATGNSSYGWFGAGIVPGPAVRSTVDRIDYSNDTATASPRGPLSLARQSLAATSASANAVNQPVPSLRTPIQVLGRYGYFGGGTGLSTVDRIDYSNDTATASPRGPLSAARGYFGATGNSSYGWFGGGNIGGVSTVDRIDYSNDTATASPKGPLSVAKYGVAATSNTSYGWFGAGASGPILSITLYSTVDRIDYSNDTATASPRGSLTQVRWSLSATGNKSYGWFGGGFTSPGTVSTERVDRIDYSNDTATALQRGNLSLARRYLAATGNSSYGWFGGGAVSPGPTTVSTVDRIDYSNDTATASPRGSLSIARERPGATGNSSYGWFGGGAPGVSTVDRIDYSNDTATASPRGPLSLARQSLAATSQTANALPQ